MQCHWLQLKLSNFSIMLLTFIHGGINYWLFKKLLIRLKNLQYCVCYVCVLYGVIMLMIISIFNYEILLSTHGLVFKNVALRFLRCMCKYFKRINQSVSQCSVCFILLEVGHDSPHQTFITIQLEKWKPIINILWYNHMWAN